MPQGSSMNHTASVPCIPPPDTELPGSTFLPGWWGGNVFHSLPTGRTPQKKALDWLHIK